jgi:chromosome segregation ATPase
MKALVFIMVLGLFLSGCSPDSQLTGSTTAELDDVLEEQDDTVKRLEPVDNEVDVVVAEQSCDDDINDFEQEIESKEWRILKIKGERSKLTMELQYKKDNFQFKDEIDGLLQQVDDLGDESDSLERDISDIQDALKILEERCE